MLMQSSRDLLLNLVVARCLDLANDLIRLKVSILFLSLNSFSKLEMVTAKSTWMALLTRKASKMLLLNLSAW